MASCSRRCASVDTARRAATTSRRSSLPWPSPAMACQCARGCCRATPPTSPRWLASSRTCTLGGSAAACSSAMPGCTRPTIFELSRGLGRYVLAVPMRRVKDVETEVLTRPGRYRKVADNLEVKEGWVGDGEPRKRYVLCFNLAEADRQRAHRAQVLAALTAELTLLDERNEDHPKAACALMASRRYGRYLSADRHGRPKLDT